MTFGWGAQFTFTDFLNKNLSNHYAVNAGIGNTNTIMQIENFFQNFKNLYEYDVIVLNFFINDLEQVKIQKPRFYQKYSYFFTFFSNTVNKFMIKLKVKEDWDSFYSKSFNDDKFIQLTLDRIGELNAYCKKNKIKFIIHNIPELRDLDNYKFIKETQIIENFAKINNIKFLNSHKELRNFNEEELWVTVKDPHANDLAHKIIGNFLKKELKSILN